MRVKFSFQSPRAAFGIMVVSGVVVVCNAEWILRLSITIHKRKRSQDKPAEQTSEQIRTSEKEQETLTCTCNSYRLVETNIEVC
ncbi:hypothetical protein HZ326_10058 [Fusarium oxysporum f. sp. albedinis]|nr:hypothetical protein HZ326_10058 [Fusarium oxysporum f. sp. albedinis]